MSSTQIHPLVERFYRNRDYQFWLCQGMGWAGISLVSFFSLNLWYNQPDFSYLAHNVSQSILGAVIAWPMRSIFNRIWNRRFWPRVTAIAIAVILLALLWATLRLLLFMAMTGERGLLLDFGGWLFPSIFIFLCWTALYHGIKYYQLLQTEHASLLEITAANHEAQLKRTQAENMAREAELKMLRYQLNPHFLFNTLNAISSLVQLEYLDQANKMIVQLSRFLRYSLDNDPLQMVPFSQEIEALQLYLRIEQTRFSDRLEVEIEIDPDTRSIPVPSLLLQPLVENAIKYAIAVSETGGKITVHSSLESGYLLVELMDTGPGMNSSDSETATGVGLRNTQERLKTMYGDDYALKLENLNPGLRVKMQIPQTPPSHYSENADPVVSGIARGVETEASVG